MRHCTVCGAEAREGAKFCTSCGARLEDATPTEAPADSGADVTGTAAIVSESEEPALEPEGEAPSTTAAEAVEVTPEPPAEEEPVAATAPVTGDPYVASWPSETTEPDEPAVAEAAPEAPVDEAPAERDAGDTDDADHHGASTWESWAPVASGESTIPSEDDPLHGVRELVDQLRHRLDRLAHPVSLQERGVDAEDIAEDLRGWASDTPDTEDILDAIRSVKASPENVTALLRLASYADDLERIIEQHGAMTSSAERWVDRLRNDA